MTRIVLASRSPRRRELLERLDVQFQMVVPDVDETPHPGEDPSAYVERLARDKARAVEAGPDTLVIAADTTVDLDGEILGKPSTHDDARRMLRRLSGRSHYVHTGVAVRLGDRVETGVDETRVQMTPIADHALEWYLGTGEPFDKAGAYALQGVGAVFVARVAGSVSNVIGLPLTLLVELAGRLGVDLVGPGAGLLG
jgi:septum formation protein